MHKSFVRLICLLLISARGALILDLLFFSQVYAKQESKAESQVISKVTPAPSPNPLPSSKKVILKPDTPMPAPAPEPIAASKIPQAAPSHTVVNEQFPTVAEMEHLMFGYSNPNIALPGRLDHLEQAVFQENFPRQTTDERIQHLVATLMGKSEAAPQGREEKIPLEKFLPPTEKMPVENRHEAAVPVLQERENYSARAEYQQELSKEALEQFALEVVNNKRADIGLGPLMLDHLASKVATEIVDDLAKRGVISHTNVKGENPDLRYTKAGGTDAILESVIVLPEGQSFKANRALVDKIIEALCSRQDDREALLSPHATHFAFDYKLAENHKDLIACCEVITKHGQIDALAHEVAVGDKVELKGRIDPPYQFAMISLAWEGENPEGLPLEEADISTEKDAMPYFPPLDYEAFAGKAERDWEKPMRLLQTAGIGLAIAGGLFLPPVALAAPLIAVSSPMPKPKAFSDIPIRGGVKISGAEFSHKFQINNSGKAGLYYITVWASVGAAGANGAGKNLIAISRQVIDAKGARESTENAEALKEGGHERQDKEEKKEKKKKKNKKADQQT